MLSHGRGDVLFVLHQKKEHEERIECQFDSFCKKVLRNEARKCYRDLKKRRRRELSLDELTIYPCPFLQWEMDAFSGHVFHALDTPIIIYHEKLAEELINMEEKYRSIILMA